MDRIFDGAEQRHCSPWSHFIIQKVDKERPHRAIRQFTLDIDADFHRPARRPLRSDAEGQKCYVVESGPPIAPAHRWLPALVAERKAYGSRHGSALRRVLRRTSSTSKSFAVEHIRAVT